MKTSKTAIVLFAIIALTFSGTVLAKGQGKGKMGMGRLGIHGPVQDEISSHLYPMRLVRRSGRDIGLTPAQTNKLQKLVTDKNAQIEKLKWEVDKEAGALADLIAKDASKKSILKQMDKLLVTESKIKKLHMTLMLEIKEVLTPEQRQKLDKLKDQFLKRRHSPVGPQGVPPGGGPGAPPM